MSIAVDDSLASASDHVAHRTNSQASSQATQSLAIPPAIERSKVAKPLSPLARLGAGVHRLLAAANHDFCPGANRYVYWLKRPVGWIVGALVTSILLASFVAPDCWALAAALTVILLLGLVWPAISIRSVTVHWETVPGVKQEGDEVEVRLRVRNRAPWPIFGLAIEHDASIDDHSITEQQRRDGVGLALARTAPFSESQFVFRVRATRRGAFPEQPPRIASGFPFGLWIARRRIDSVQTVHVRPWSCQLTGSSSTRSGSGPGHAACALRSGRIGEVTGFRDWTEHDSFREIDWVQTSRRDRLMVRDRSAAVRPAVRLALLGKSEELSNGANPQTGETRSAADALAIRWLASVARTLVEAGWEVRVRQADRWIALSSPSSLTLWLDRLAQAHIDDLSVSHQHRLAADSIETWAFDRISVTTNHNVSTKAFDRQLGLSVFDSASLADRDIHEQLAMQRELFARVWNQWCEERRRVSA